MAVLLLAAAGAAVVVAAVSGGDERTPQAASPARAQGPVAPRAAGAHPGARSPAVVTIGGKALQSARCRQWRMASTRERDAIVETLARVVGGPTPYGPASTIPDDAAHRLFDRTCVRSFARGFLLYELYTRAAGFNRAPTPTL